MKKRDRQDAFSKKDRPVAALNLIADPEELERLLLTSHPKFQAVLETADREIQEAGGINHDDFWSSIG